jgi:hypothetical protein
VKTKQKKSDQFAAGAALVEVNGGCRAVRACDRGHTVGTRAWARSIELGEGAKRFYKGRGVNS